MLGRSCTRDFKIMPIRRGAISRCGIKRGEKSVQLTQWIGISFDEIQRMKPSRDLWAQHRWPLVELRMRRNDCLKWMTSNNYPMPPRSACVFCPYHSDGEWRRLKLEEPEAFAAAVKFEGELQRGKAASDNMRVRVVPFLHRSLRPLDKVDFSTAEDNGQQRMFGNECDGMCGV